MLPSARALDELILSQKKDSDPKVMIVGTQKLKIANQIQNIFITVDGAQIQELGSEKLLGLVINNKLTWKEYLYGDEENAGLIGQLKQRVGLL